MRREVVKELIQKELNTENLKEALGEILQGVRRSQVLEDYALLRKALGEGGASKKTAKLMQKYMQRKKEQNSLHSKILKEDK